MTMTGSSLSEPVVPASTATDSNSKENKSSSSSNNNIKPAKRHISITSFFAKEGGSSAKKMKSVNKENIVNNNNNNTNNDNTITPAKKMNIGIEEKLNITTPVSSLVVNNNNNNNNNNNSSHNCEKKDTTEDKNDDKNISDSSSIEFIETITTPTILKNDKKKKNNNSSSSSSSNSNNKRNSDKISNSSSSSSKKSNVLDGFLQKNTPPTTPINLLLTNKNEINNNNNDINNGINNDINNDKTTPVIKMINNNNNNNVENVEKATAIAKTTPTNISKKTKSNSNAKSKSKSVAATKPTSSKISPAVSKAKTKSNSNSNSKVPATTTTKIAKTTAAKTTTTTTTPAEQQKVVPVINVVDPHPDTEEYEQLLSKLQDDFIFNTNNIFTNEDDFQLGLSEMVNETIRSNTTEIENLIGTTENNNIEYLPDFLNPILSCIIQGRSLSLVDMTNESMTILNKVLLDDNNNNNGDLVKAIHDKIGIDGISEKIKLIADRKCYGLKQHKNMDEIKYSDTNRIHLWRWEVSVLGVYRPCNEKRIKKVRTDRTRVQRYFTTLTNLIKLLKENKNEKKINDEKVKFDKIKKEDYNARQQRILDKKKEETKLKLEEERRLKKEQAEAEKAERAKLLEEKKRAKDENEAISKKRKHDSNENSSTTVSSGSSSSLQDSSKKQKSLFGFFTQKLPVEKKQNIKNENSKSAEDKNTESPELIAFMKTFDENINKDFNFKDIIKSNRERSLNNRRQSISTKRKHKFIEVDVSVTESAAQIVSDNGLWGQTSYATMKKKKIWNRYKHLQFAEDHRPPWFGTWSKVSSVIGSRKPSKKDKKIMNYDYDSEEDWEEEEVGESLSDDEEEEKEVGNEKNELDYDDGWLTHDNELDGEKLCEIKDKEKSTGLNNEVGKLFVHGPLYLVGNASIDGDALKAVASFKMKIFSELPIKAMYEPPPVVEIPDVVEEEKPISVVGQVESTLVSSTLGVASPVPNNKISPPAVPKNQKSISNFFTKGKTNPFAKKESTPTSTKTSSLANKETITSTKTSPFQSSSLLDKEKEIIDIASESETDSNMFVERTPNSKTYFIKGDLGDCKKIYKKSAIPNDDDGWEEKKVSEYSSSHNISLFTNLNNLNKTAKNSEKKEIENPVVKL